MRRGRGGHRSSLEPLDPGGSGGVRRGRQVYGTAVRVIGARGEPGGQRGAQPVGRVDVAAEDHDRHVAGARPLERGGRGLGAGARYPGVVEKQHTGSRPSPFGYKPVRVGVAALLARPDDQPGHWQPQVGAGQREQRVRSRAAAAGRHHGQAAGGGHARVPPHAAAVVVQEGEQQGQQTGSRRGVRRPPGLVAPQAGGERGALHRVGDGRHGVGEQARAEQVVLGALVAAGVPGARRAAADGAGARAARRLERVEGDPSAQDGPGIAIGAADVRGRRAGHAVMVRARTDTAARSRGDGES